MMLFSWLHSTDTTAITVSSDNDNGHPIVSLKSAPEGPKLGLCIWSVLIDRARLIAII
jgi:hypothetical protein